MSERLGERTDQCATSVRDHVIVLFLRTLMGTVLVALFRLHGLEFDVACQRHGLVGEIYRSQTRLMSSRLEAEDCWHFQKWNVIVVVIFQV